MILLLGPFLSSPLSLLINAYYRFLLLPLLLIIVSSCSTKNNNISISITLKHFKSIFLFLNLPFLFEFAPIFPKFCFVAMAEEHGFQSPEGHRLCANNCGFFGVPTTLNLCSKCYRDHCIKEDQAKSAKSAVENSLFLPSSSAAALAPAVVLSVVSSPAVSAEEEGGEGRVPTAAGPNRCSVCRKRVGLTGFNCRCGTTFCGAHRYPERHGCTFDYKAVGREAIARDNPVVKAEKLEKI
ncbi:hypothetical protein CsSME_00016774 [Camellia sinensis var. sinensis]